MVFDDFKQNLSEGGQVSFVEGVNVAQRGVGDPCLERVELRASGSPEATYFFELFDVTFELTVISHLRHAQNSSLKKASTTQGLFQSPAVYELVQVRSAKDLQETKYV